MCTLLTPAPAALSDFSSSISPRFAHVFAPPISASPQQHQPASMALLRCSAESLNCHPPTLDRESSQTRLNRSADDLSSQLEQYSVFPGVSDNEFYSSWIASQFAAPLQSSPSLPKQKQESSERENFYVNMGFAIRNLREEMPSVFYKDLNYDIYRDDIVFRDPRNIFAGIDKYKLIFWALRFHGRIFFKAIWVDVVRVWQPSDRVIIVRWTVRGTPRVPWEAQGTFEGTSEYKLDKEGKIYEHKVDNVVLNYPPMFKTQTVMDLLSSAGGATPTPTFFDRVVLACWMAFPYSKISTWERFYLALTATLDIQNNKRWSWYAALY